jgi:hypothetical protein
MASFEHSSLQIRVDRVDRVYRPGEVVAGTVVARVRKGWRHQGVGLRALGAVEIAHHLPPRPFMNVSSVLTPPGHFSDGEHALRFEMELRPCEGAELLESYHGSANVAYTLICTCRRGPLRPALEARGEIFVEVPSPGPPPEPAPTTFTVAREKLQVSGKVDTRCSLDRPFTGELRVDECVERIRSIDIALMRRETVSGVLGRAAEVRRTQIVDGDVKCGIDIPIHVFFPRLFACPSLSIDGLSLAFEVDVVVSFGEGLVARESIPVVLYR